MKNNPHLFLIALVLGAVLGALFGVFLPEQAVKSGFIGEIFLNALKMMVLPLVATSLIVGVTNLGDIRKLGSMGIRTFVYYTLTTGIAVAVGIALVVLIRPGEGYGEFAGSMPQAVEGKHYSPIEVLLGLIHPNLVQAAADFKVLPIIIASLIFGSAIATLGEKGEVLVRFFDAANEAVMKVVHWIVFFTPAGVFSLIAYRLGIAGGGDAFFDIISQLSKYCFTVIAGLLAHGLIVLPLILFLLTRRNPLSYFTNMGKALMTAFATASSSATLPVTMECATKENKVKEEVSNVVLPIGATVNMDGTALYEAVAAIFIAQSYGIDLQGGQLLIVFLTATLAAVGAAGIPEAGLVTMVLVLESVGLPAEGIGLILAVDWFLDRCRTTVNVWGDAVGAAVIDKTESG